MEEKNLIKVNYNGSGVKTLSGFGTFFIVIASIAIIIALINIIIYVDSLNSYSWERDNYASCYSIAVYFFSLSVGSYAIGAICLGLSTITKTALYRRTLLENQFIFVEKLHE